MHRLVFSCRASRLALALLGFLLLSLPEAAFAQFQPPAFRWASRAGGTADAENQTDMAVDAGGNTVIVGALATGSSAFFGPFNVTVQTGDDATYVAKYDPNGNPVWVTAFRSRTQASTRRTTIDPQGNVYVLGYFVGDITIGTFSFQAAAGSKDAFVAKLSPAGQVIWAKQFGGSLDEYNNTGGNGLNSLPVGGIAVSPAGNVFIAFDFAGSMVVNAGSPNPIILTSQGDQDVAVIKLDSSGNYLTATRFGSLNADGPRDLKVDQAGNVVVLGFSYGNVVLGGTVLNTFGSQDGFIAKLDSNLQPIWLQGFGGQGIDSPMGLAIDPAGNIIVVGYADANFLIGGVSLVVQNGLDAYVAKFSPAGQMAWVQQASGFGGSGDELAHSVVSDAGGFIFVNGRFNSQSITFGSVSVPNSSGSAATYIVKFDPSGNALWGQGATATRGFVGFAATPGSILGFNSGVAYDQLGRFYIAGRYEGVATLGTLTLTNAGGGDIFIASLDGDFSIVQHPQNQFVKQGATASFDVVTASALPLSYQWLFNGNPIPGATATNFSVFNAQPSQSGLYSVLVSGFTGTLLSSNATLTVKIPPAIVQNPQGRTVTIGSTVTFSAVSTGDAPLAYRWFFNNQPINNAINPTLTITNAQPADAGVYALEVSNDVGSAMSAGAGLFINAPAVVLASPQSQSVVVGSNAVFSVSPGGSAPFTYQWRFNGAPISGAVSQTYTITDAQSTNAGSYDVLVANSISSVFSSNAILTVTPPFTISPQPQSQSVLVGNNVTFTVGTAGIGSFNGPYTYQWYFNSDPLPGETNPLLSATNLQLTNSGIYSCLVGSSQGSLSSSNALLTVFNPFSIGSPGFQLGGLFQMTASGDNGSAYRLETTTNLVDWVPVVTNTVSGGTATFTDSGAAGKELRFYRIVLLP